MVLHGLSRPGKLLLPGSCLLGPASSSCRGPCLECLVFSWRFLGGPRRRVLQLPVHKSGVLRYPYFSTPTGAPGPGPHTVPSVVGPGPNSAWARVAWVALLLNSATVAPSPGGARLSRHRGGEACEACGTWAACAGLNRAGMRHVAHDSFSPKKGRNARSLFKWRETWRRDFRGARSPRSRGGERSPHPSPRPSAPATWSSCTWGHGGGGREPVRRGSRQWVGPSRLPFLRFDWWSGAVVPPLHPFIRSGRGQRKS